MTRIYDNRAAARAGIAEELYGHFEIELSADELQALADGKTVAFDVNREFSVGVSREPRPPGWD